MKSIYKIAKLELSILFFSPIAWLVLIIFSIQCGVNLTEWLDRYVTYFEQGSNLSGLTNRVFSVTYRGYFFVSIKDNLFLYLPLLTMGLISRELSSGSIKLLLSSPINFIQIVLGKYLAMVVYGLFLSFILVISMLAGGISIENFDYPLVLSGIIGLFLLICAYASIGLFISSLTSYQVVAAVGTMATLLLLNYIDQIGQTIPFLSDIFYWISMEGRTDQMINGLISSKSIIYFCAVIVFFLLITMLRLSFQRNTVSLFKKIASYTVVCFFTFSAAYLGSNPYLATYFDLTANNAVTLTKEGQGITNKLKDKPIVLTYYVNILDGNSARSGLPKYKNFNYRKMEPYTRFLPQLELNYVYYYDTVPAISQIYRDNPGLYGKELAKKVAKSYKLDFKDVLSPKEIRKIVNLEPEQNQYISQFTADNKKSFVRMFEDVTHYPGPEHVVSSLKQLTTESPLVGFITSNGSKSLSKNDSDLWNGIMQREDERRSLLNIGFDVQSVNLSTVTNLNSFDILVIASPTQEFNPSDLEKIMSYFESGGNALILADVNAVNVLNPITNHLGLELTSGQIIQDNTNLLPSFVIGDLVDEATTVFKSRNISRWIKSKYNNVAMPGAVGIAMKTNTEFYKTGILKLTRESYLIPFDNTLERETDSILFKSAKKDVTGIYTGMAMKRQVSGKSQRILVFGDADFMSNAQYNNRNVPNVNSFLIKEIFQWLSNDTFPPNVRPEEAKDDLMLVNRNEIGWMRIFLAVIIPLLILMAGLFIIIKRKRI
ncbi:Gldg family protein [uncultured Polaribacter sp.]|uniref:Gldg family protein n=1 Tax=uncultured Polaribacter sp. TaxID=174711 RepID=UPI0026211EEE|nr:Gldg family protein [uncultured Polaribacter sp.]